MRKRGIKHSSTAVKIIIAYNNTTRQVSAEGKNNYDLENGYKKFATYNGFLLHFKLNFKNK